MEDFRTETIPDPNQQEESGRGWKRTLFDILETILLSVILFLVINTVSSRIRVESISMQPTLYAGNFVLVNKLAYRIGSPQRGDVIVFKYPPDPSQTPYIKRVIGLPGDDVKISGGKVTVNGETLIEPYLKTTTNRGGEWRVPEGKLFVMGDNRNNSSDSRTWGYVPLENVIGKAELVYWPPQQWGLLDIPHAVAAGEQ